MAYYSIPWQEAVSGAGSNIFAVIYEFLPNLLGAIIVFLIGLILANWVKGLVVRILESIQLSNIVKNTSFEHFLEKAEVKSKIEEIIGTVLKWLVILIFTVASINILGLPTISSVLNSVLAYIPKVISAVFILGLGVLLAGVIESLVKGAVGQFDVRIGRLLGKVASYMMMIFATLAALNELGIAKELINILFVGIVSMLALGFGLAIGLGAKDLVAQVLQDWYKQLKQEAKEKSR